MADWFDELEPDEINKSLTGWRFESDAQGNWRGLHLDGRRTALKSATTKPLRRSAFVWAQHDAVVNRIVCAQWPDCEHGAPEGCKPQALKDQRAVLTQARRLAQAGAQAPRGAQQGDDTANGVQRAQRPAHKRRGAVQLDLLSELESIALQEAEIV